MLKSILRSSAKFLVIFSLLFNSLSSPVFASTNNIANGAKIFEANCAGCHIKGKNIVRRGKNLKLKALHKYKVDNQEAIVALITNGKGIMSAYGDKLSSQEIADVSSYVLQKAEENWK